jgi:hypothetical protein
MESIDLTLIYCEFSRFKTFYTLKIEFGAKFFFRLSRGVAGIAGIVPVFGRNLYRRYLCRLKGYRFKISALIRQLCLIDAPHTQNFEILKSLEQTQESKKFAITFVIFVKMLDGLIFCKRCL